jgi:glutamine amidotransferase
MKIAIVDYGVGNTQSILNAFERLGVKSIDVLKEKDELTKMDGLILPGVGAFGACSAKLKENGLSDILNELVIAKKKPILGICVGMQLMAESSEENGYHKGLAWIPGKVRLIDKKKINLPIPHVGWNNIIVKKPDVIFNEIINNADFYFDHSYHFLCEKKYVAATCKYGINLNVAISYENIFGVQFHPEKSSLAGLRLYRNFLNYISQC